MNIYQLLIHKPLFNLLVFLYETVAFGDLGIAIIAFTIVVRIILYPLFARSVRHQLVMQKLQPEIRKIQERYPKDREKQGVEMLALYKKHQINPFSGIGLLIIQLPILFALFRIFSDISGHISPELLYSFVPRPDGINHWFLGLIPLDKPSMIIAVLAALAQYFQARQTAPKLQKGRESSTAEAMGRNMVYIAPVLTLVLLYSFPAALGLYWLVTSLFSIAQQRLIDKNYELARIRSNNDGESRVQ